MIHSVLRGGLRALVLPFLRLRGQGWEWLQAPGPVLLAGNHPSILDGLVLALLIPRRVRFVVAPELLAVPLLGRLLRWLGAIPAGRGAVPAAIEALGRGELVAIFPEGTTNGGLTLLPFRSGVTRIASGAGVPVTPFGLDGTQRSYPARAGWARPARVELAVGPPTAPGGLREQVEQLWRQCREREPQPWRGSERWAAGLAGVVLIPLSLAVTLLHCSPAARALIRQGREDAR